MHHDPWISIFLVARVPTHFFLVICHPGNFPIKAINFRIVRNFLELMNINSLLTCFQELKGSVERSLLPWAMFLIFTQNRPRKSEHHFCMLFFIEMSKERLEKSERAPPVSWRPWALAYSRDRPYNFSCLSVLSKTGRFCSFFSDLGCHLARKSLSWPAISVSNEKQEFKQRKRIKLFDDFWVRAYRFNFAPKRRHRARWM